ncbi:hypothetical protein PENTCL1PPCAC_21248, partial [Pristionchus entomophagus]
MNEEGDVPNYLQTDKSTAPTLLQRVGSMTGITKKVTKENKTLNLKVDQLAKEVEERKTEIDRYKINEEVSENQLAESKTRISQ